MGLRPATPFPHSEASSMVKASVSALHYPLDGRVPGGPPCWGASALGDVGSGSPFP